MNKYKKMTLEQLKDEYAKLGRKPVKLLADGKWGAMSKEEMAEELARWDEVVYGISRVIEGGLK